MPFSSRIERRFFFFFLNLLDDPFLRPQDHPHPNLIPVKFCFWQETFAILREMYHLDDIYLTNISENV